MKSAKGIRVGLVVQIEGNANRWLGHSAEIIWRALSKKNGPAPILKQVVNLHAAVRPNAIATFLFPRVGRRQ